MIAHDQQLAFGQATPAPRKADAEYVRRCRAVLRENRGRVLTTEQVEERLARRGR